MSFQLQFLCASIFNSEIVLLKFKKDISKVQREFFFKYEFKASNQNFE